MGQGGIRIYLSENASKSLMGCNPVSDRVLSVRLQGTPTNITVMQVYVPTTYATDEEVDQFYEAIQKTIDATPAGEMLVLMGDFNAKIGEGLNPGEESIIGCFGIGHLNERGEQLASFAAENDPIVCNTIFKHHKR